ncbi:MAG: methylated-DNA--[protein]-cysteine S-methyltransferase [Actinomycetes bacterium]|jgi:methylated-DNA-[protein]-cysteine S-methyltransferase
MTQSRLAVRGAGGTWTVEGDNDGLTKIYLPHERVRATTTSVSPLVKRAVKQLEQYFAGSRRQFDVDLHVGGTDFQVDVWLALAAIPFGTIATYQDIAREVGVPNGYRAVGNANAKNPFPIVVPCHRVVAKSGLGGYAGGLDVKRALLLLEGVSDYT